MRMSTKVRYAVRAMTELAIRGNSAPTTVKTVSEAQTISPKYAKQIMNRLQRSGLVKGYPGVRGGYVLARKANKVTVLDVYEAMTGRLDIAPCVSVSASCGRVGVCSAGAFWKQFSGLVESGLRSMTIAELAKCEESLREGTRT